MLSVELCHAYENILIEELRPAMGCTEPIAIAYAASILRDVLGADPEEITIGLSGNIIKNVKSVIVPSTGGMHGIEAAVAAGVISACPQKRLELLGGLTDEDRARIDPYRQSCRMTVKCTLHIMQQLLKIICARFKPPIPTSQNL